MWIFTLQTHENYSSLECYYRLGDTEDSISITIQKRQNTLLQFMVTADLGTAALIRNRMIAVCTVQHLPEPRFRQDEPNIFFLEINVAAEYLSLNAMLNVCSDTLPEFDQVRSELNQFVEIDRLVAQHSLAMQQSIFNRNFNARAENTMDPFVLLSARKSELLLRAEFNFPAPMYAIDYGDNNPLEHHAFFTNTEFTDTDQIDLEDTVSEFDVNDFLAHAQQPLLFLAPNADGGNEMQVVMLSTPDAYDTDDDEHTIDYPDDDNSYYTESTGSDSPPLPLMIAPNIVLMYEQSENDAIAAFFAYLYQQRDNLAAAGHIELHNNINYRLSPALIQVLTVARNGEQPANLNFARDCLDLLTTIRALHPTGSHSDNTDMQYTLIFGYGLRNIVALMWHCAIIARDSQPSKLMNGVTFDDAITALIHGIAEGARGKNRNQETGIDDLYEVDNRDCDQGRYNRLIASYVGILPQVQIQYNAMEIFLSFLEKEVYAFILNEIDDYSACLDFISNWSAGIPDPNPTYIALVTKLNNSYPELQSKFLSSACADDPDLRARIQTELERVVNEMQRAAFGYSIIEQVTLDVNEFNHQWDKWYPPVVSSSEPARQLLGV